jgi:hypothetical protein
LAARIGAFEAWLCYAKITPATLRRGEFAPAGGAGAEALGCNLKFRPGEWWRVTAGWPAPAVKTHRMAAS